MNDGYITNLPRDCCVEVPVYADRLGLHPCRSGRLPSPLAAMNQSNVTVQQLGVEAALTGDPELVVAAIAMDPLTSSVLSLEEIRDMTIEMFEGERAVPAAVPRKTPPQDPPGEHPERHEGRGGAPRSGPRGGKPLRQALRRAVMLRGAFAREDITPDGQVSLLGYFTDRRSEGVLDRLHCRLARLSSGSGQLLFVQVDSCLFGSGDAARLAAAASRASGVPTGAVIVFASHTHTAPGLADLYDVRRDAAYLDLLESRIRQAAARLGAGEPVQARICRARAPGLASNRRWWLSGGTVATNPPRMHPSLVRPEGPVDDEVNTVAFHGPDGRARCLFVSVSNHVDTLGGNLLSADWPGVMEAEVGASLCGAGSRSGGAAPIVIPFIGAAGNINHFDFTRAAEQTTPAETRRMGAAYAAAVLASLDAAEPVRGEPLWSTRRVLRVPGIEIADAETQRARAILDRPRPRRPRRQPRAATSPPRTSSRETPQSSGSSRARSWSLPRAGPTRTTCPSSSWGWGRSGFSAFPGSLSWRSAWR